MWVMVYAVGPNISKSSSKSCPKNFRLDRAGKGTSHSPDSPDQSIWINQAQSQYVNDSHPISISKERRSNPDDVVNESERQSLSLRAVIGSLQYMLLSTADQTFAAGLDGSNPESIKRRYPLCLKRIERFMRPRDMPV